jgi:hypothetical protein
MAFQSADPHDRNRLIDHAVDYAYGTSVKLAERGGQDMVYPTPLANAAVEMTRQSHAPFGQG